MNIQKIEFLGHQIGTHNTKQERANHIDCSILAQRQATKKVRQKKSRQNRRIDDNTLQAINTMKINCSHTGM